MIRLRIGIIGSFDNICTKLNTTEQYELLVYKHYKQSPTNILNDQIPKKSHTLFDTIKHRNHNNISAIPLTMNRNIAASSTGTVKHWKLCTWHQTASAKNSSKLNEFLHSEVNRLIQHIIVQDQDGQNNNIYWNVLIHSGILNFDIPPLRMIWFGSTVDSHHGLTVSQKQLRMVRMACWKYSWI